MNTKNVNLGNSVLHEHSYSKKFSCFEENNPGLQYFRQILVQEEHNYCKEPRNVGDKRDSKEHKVNKDSKIKKAPKKKSAKKWHKIKENLELVDLHTVQMKLPKELLKESDERSRRIQRLEEYLFADEMPQRQESHKFGDFDFKKYL